VFSAEPANTYRFEPFHFIIARTLGLALNCEATEGEFSTLASDVICTSTAVI
jgi:hypothetical protein